MSVLLLEAKKSMTDMLLDYLLGGGSHLAKISTVLEWLENSNDVENDELVVMMDAYGWSHEVKASTMIDRKTDMCRYMVPTATRSPR